jgi:hypothetical protein
MRMSSNAARPMQAYAGCEAPYESATHFSKEVA